MKKFLALCLCVLCLLCSAALADDSIFTIEEHDNYVEITGVVLEPDQTVLFVPESLNGKHVERIEFQQFPEQLEVVYTHNQTYLSIDNGTADYFNIDYVDYEFVIQNKDRFKAIHREMAEGDYALYSMTRYHRTPNGSNSDSTTYPAEDLIAEHEGVKFFNGLYYYYLSYEHEGITFTYNSDDHSSVGIIDMPFNADADILLVPSTVNGVEVNSIDLSFVGAREELTVLHPSSCWIDGTTDIDVVHAFQYQDRAYRDRHEYSFDINYAELYSDVPTIMVTYYSMYEYGSRVDEATVEYSSVPTSIDGVTVLNRLDEDDVKTYKSGDYTYVKLNDTDVAIVGYNNEFATSATVPSRLDGLTVTHIFGLGSWSYGIESGELTSLELPATLKVLGNNAINCYNLKTITIPSGLEEIGTKAFAYMGYKANALKLPEGLTKLGASWSYGYGSRLKTIKLPSTVTEIPEYCFYRASFKELKLTDSIQSIGASAFENMYYLSSLTLPSTLTAIPDRMAAACEKLSKITIPANVVSIGKEAFAGCPKFASITFKGKNTLTTIGDSAFASTALKKFAPPEGVTTIGAYVANTCNSLTTVVLPNSVTSVGEYAFTGCAKLTKVTLSEGMTSIPEGMFMGCKKLSAITIPASVTEIGDYAFEGCSDKLTITVFAGSYAEQWANENGYKVKVKKAK